MCATYAIELDDDVNRLILALAQANQVPPSHLMEYWIRQEAEAVFASAFHIDPEIYRDFRKVSRD